MKSQSGTATAKTNRNHVARGARIVFAVGTLSIVMLFVLVFVASAIRANNYHSSHHSHRQKQQQQRDEGGDAAADTTLREKRIAHPRLALHELRALGELEQVDAESLVNDHWLPLNKRDQVAVPHRGHHSKRHVSEKTRHHIDLSVNAERISHDTYYLGEHDHPSIKGQTLHGYAFVHYHGHSERAKQTAERDHEDRAKYNYFNRTTQHQTKHRAILKRSSDDDDDAAAADPWQNVKCSAPIRHGARMRHSAGYFLHTDNGSNLKSRDIALSIEQAMDTWRCVFKRLSIEPLGPLLGIVEPDSPDDQPIVFDRPTGENHVGFGSLTLPDGSEDQTLGITVSFGVFDAEDPDDRFLAEFKTIYNDDYHWGMCEEAPQKCLRKNSIDLPSITVHESGHAFGLDDLYAKECKHMTMYWSSPPGDTSKRSLEDEDIQGMLTLYK